MTERAAKVCGGARIWLAALEHGKVHRKKAMQHRLIDVMEINTLRSQPPSEVGRALQVVLDSNTCCLRPSVKVALRRRFHIGEAMRLDNYRDISSIRPCAPGTRPT